MIGKILYYASLGFWIIIGTPIALLIILCIWIQDKFHKLTCKKCRY
jgi:hypothetical protein